MDPVTIIVSALVLGAAAGLRPTAEQAVKDSYEALKRLIRDRYQRAQPAVEMVEQDPEEEAFREAARKALAREGAGEDEALLRQANEVIQTVDAHARQTAAAVNINLSELKVQANLRISGLSAAGEGGRVDVTIERTETGGDLEVSDIHAGNGESADSKKAGRQ